MMDASETIDCQGQNNGLGKIGHCLNHPKPSENFFSKETLARLTGRVSKEEHDLALARIVELETQLALTDDSYSVLVEKNKQHVMSVLEYHINHYGWNQMLTNILDVSDICNRMSYYFEEDFQRRLAERSDPRNVVINDTEQLELDVRFLKHYVGEKIKSIKKLNLCTSKTDVVDLMLSLDNILNDFIRKKTESSL